MISDQLFDDGITHPIFFSAFPYMYQVTYSTDTHGDQTISYSSPHEIILNLHCFNNEDKISYLDRNSKRHLFTISVDKFKYNVAKSTQTADLPVLELLYMKLLLTNRFSNSIPDRGRFRQYDHILRQWLLTIKGGYEIYLTAEKSHTIFYGKARRTSALHLLATIDHWNNQHGIHMSHINLPLNMANRGLVFECLKVQLPAKRFKLYQYDPLEEDNILVTDMSREVIQVINQLIK